MPVTDCPTCRGNTVLDDGYPCPDCREDYDDGFEHGCTHCGGDGLCYDGSDPLGDCPDIAHRCHACNGSGRRADQTIF